MKFFYFLIIVSISNLLAEQNDSLKQYNIKEISVSGSNAVRTISTVPFEELKMKELKQKISNIDLPSIMNSMTSVISYSESGNWIGYSNMTLRGFDQRRISVYINGIPQNDPEDHNVYWINFADIQESLEKIQIQRGAGIASYGAPSIAGSINLQTTNLGKTRGINIFSGAGFQTFGDKIPFNNNKFKIEYSSGLIDGKYSFYGKLGSINSFGYRDKSFANLSNYFFSASRYDNNLITQINVYGGMQKDGLAYIGLPKSYIANKNLRTTNYSYWEYDNQQNVGYATTLRPQEIEEFAQPHYEILNTLKVNEKVTINSSLFYYSGSGYFDYSGAGWADNAFGLDPSNGFDSTYSPANSIIRSWVGNKQGGWLPSIDIQQESGLLKIGAEMRFQRSDHWGKINYATGLPDSYDPYYNFYFYNGAVDIYSLYLKKILKVTDKFNLHFDGQLVYKNYMISNEKNGKNYKEYFNQDGSTFQAKDLLFEVPYIFFNPKIGANYKFNEKINIYGMIAYTNREPRMVNLYNASEGWTGATPNFASSKTCDTCQTYYFNFNSPIVTPERMLDVELGVNYTLDNFIFDANTYWMEFNDELVKNGQLNVFGAPIDANIPKTRHIGLELMAKYNLETQYGDFSIQANSTISSNKIIDYNYQINDTTYQSMNGNQIAGFPDFMANFTISYSKNNFNLALIGKYVGEMKTDNFGNFLGKEVDLGYTDNKIDDYFVMNFNFSYEIQEILDLNSIRFQLQIINFTNQLYAPYAVGQQFFPAAERSIFLGINFNI